MGTLATIGTLVTQMTLESSGFGKGATIVEGRSQSMASRLRKDAALVGAGIGAAVGGGLVTASRAFEQFDTQMREVFTLMPGISGPAMKAMEGQVQSFSKEFGIMPEEVVPALYSSLSAGIPPGNVFEFLETANMLAQGGVAETKEAVSLLASVTKGYGDTSAEAQMKVADLAVTTVRLGETTIPELAAAIGKAIPLAAALGIEGEELFGTFATLTGVTGNTAEVSTQLKATFDALIAQRPPMLNALETMGFATSEAALESLGFKGVLDGLVKSTGGSSAKLKELLGSSEALTAVLSLTGEQTDVFSEKLTQMSTEAAGASVESFETMDAGVRGIANRIRAQVANFAIDVGRFIEPIAPLMSALGPAFGIGVTSAIGGAIGKIAGSEKLAAGWRSLGRNWGKVLGIAIGVGLVAWFALEGKAILDKFLEDSPLDQTGVALATGKAFDFRGADPIPGDTGVFRFPWEESGFFNQTAEVFADELGGAIERGTASRFENKQLPLMDFSKVSFNMVTGAITIGRKSGEEAATALVDAATKKVRQPVFGGRGVPFGMLERMPHFASVTGTKTADAFRASVASGARNFKSPFAGMFSGIGEGTREALTDIRGFIKTGRQELRDGMQSWRESLENPWRGFGKKLKGNMKEAQRELDKAIREDDPVRIALASDMVTKLSGQIKDFRALKNSYKDRGNDIKAEATVTAAAMPAKGTAIVKGIAAGISSPESIAAIQNAMDVVNTTIEENIKTESPAKKGILSKGGGPEGWGVQLGRGFGRGISRGFRDMGVDVTPVVGGAQGPAGVGTSASGPQGRGGDVHIHVGTLIADDAGLRELSSRIDQSLRVITRERRFVNLPEG